jgi:voltage-dependent potassium channel beta subunit
MEYQRLGKSGLKVSKLSFGSWITFGNQIDDSVASSLMHFAYDQGINFFDNAEIYANGKSEVVMGNILKKTSWPRSSYIISSKVYFGDGGRWPTQVGLNRKHVFEACNAALQRLQLDYLDLFFCHRPDKECPMEETVWAMNHLIQQGKILYWGTSEWSAQEIMESHFVAAQNNLIGPTMEQPQYNMFTRRKVEVEYHQIYKNQGLGTTIWSPLASGTLTSKFVGKIPTDSRLNRDELDWLKEKALTVDRVRKIEALNQVAQKVGTSLAKLAIAWCAKNENVSTVILGASKLSQLQETITSLEVIPLITTEIESEIELILENKPKLPPF